MAATQSNEPPPPPPPVTPVATVYEARERASSTATGIEATMRRIAALPDGDRHRRVDDEWSAVETLRHMAFVIDVWLSKTILGETDPFHPIGLPPHFMPRVLPGSSIEPDAQPTADEACEVLRGRLASVAAYVDELTEKELTRPIEAHAGTVAGGLGVLFDELKFHNDFITRDLDVIAGP